MSISGVPCLRVIGPIDPDDAGRWCAIGTLLVACRGAAGDGFPAGRNAARERRDRQLRLCHRRTGAGNGRPLCGGAGPERGRSGRPATALRPGPPPVRLSGDGAADTAALRAAAPGPIDAVQDFLPPSVAAAVARAAIMSLRQGGRAILMGGVGMLGGEDLSLPYPRIMRNLITVRGLWMYDTAAMPGLIGLMRSGLLGLDHRAMHAFLLTQANEAVAYAAADAGPLKLTVLEPQPNSTKMRPVPSRDRPTPPRYRDGRHLRRCPV